MKSESEIRERLRVASLLASDAACRVADVRRIDALRQVRAGNFANIDDTVLPPTPEQLGKGEFVLRTADKTDGTVRAVKHHRRVVRARIVTLHTAGVIDDHMFAACMWYRNIWESSGYDRTISISMYGDKISSHSRYGETPITEMYAESRELIRQSSKAIGNELLPFFNAVTIMDLALSEAARQQGCRYYTTVKAYRTACMKLLGFADQFLPSQKKNELAC